MVEKRLAINPPKFAETIRLEALAAFCTSLTLMCSVREFWLVAWLPEDLPVSFLDDALETADESAFLSAWLNLVSSFLRVASAACTALPARKPPKDDCREMCRPTLRSPPPPSSVNMGGAGTIPAAPVVNERDKRLIGAATLLKVLSAFSDRKENRADIFLGSSEGS
jgi:hypothetical protein